jgi:hypothetical protein
MFLSVLSGAVIGSIWLVNKSALHLLIGALCLSFLATTDVCPEKFKRIGIPHSLMAVGTIVMELLLLLRGLLEPLEEDTFAMDSYIKRRATSSFLTSRIGEYLVSIASCAGNTVVLYLYTPI